MLRYAFSPTKDMDIENLRLALFNHILSKKRNEELLVRIDDTDKENNIEGKEKEILEILSLFSIDHSRVLYQSENIKYHTQMAMKLLLDKKSFNCFCSDEALEKDKKIAKRQNKPYSYSGFCETISDETKFNCNAPFVVRLKKPENNIKFTDQIKGDFEHQPFEIDSLKILNHDKSPTPTFTAAVDDMLFDISTIITEEKNFLETSRQIHVRESLGYDKQIEQIHLCPILNLTKKNNYSVNSLIEKGYLPAAIANYVILIGYETSKGIFTIEEIIQDFDINKIIKIPTSFDIEKLNYINKEYMKMLDEMRFSKIIGFADEDIGKLAKLYIGECNTTKEIKTKITSIFSEKKPLKGFEEEFTSLKNCLKSAPFIQDFEQLQKYITDKTTLQGETLSKVLSFALTGSKNEKNLDKIYPLIQNYLGEIIK